MAHCNTFQQDGNLISVKITDKLSSNNKTNKIKTVTTLNNRNNVTEVSNTTLFQPVSHFRASNTQNSRNRNLVVVDLRDDVGKYSKKDVITDFVGKNNATEPKQNKLAKECKPTSKNAQMCNKKVNEITVLPRKEAIIKDSCMGNVSVSENVIEVDLLTADDLLQEQFYNDMSMLEIDTTPEVNIDYLLNDINVDEIVEALKESYTLEKSAVNQHNAISHQASDINRTLVNEEKKDQGLHADSLDNKTNICTDENNETIEIISSFHEHLNDRKCNKTKNNLENVISKKALVSKNNEAVAAKTSKSTVILRSLESTVKATENPICEDRKTELYFPVTNNIESHKRDIGKKERSEKNYPITDFSPSTDGQHIQNFHYISNQNIININEEKPQQRVYMDSLNEQTKTLITEHNANVEKISSLNEDTMYRKCNEETEIPISTQVQMIKNNNEVISTIKEPISQSLEFKLEATENLSCEDMKKDVSVGDKACKEKKRPDILNYKIDNSQNTEALLIESNKPTTDVYTEIPKRRISINVNTSELNQIVQKRYITKKQTEHSKGRRKKIEESTQKDITPVKIKQSKDANKLAKDKVKSEKQQSNIINNKNKLPKMSNFKQYTIKTAILLKNKNIKHSVTLTKHKLTNQVECSQNGPIINTKYAIKNFIIPKIKKSKQIEEKNSKQVCVTNLKNATNDDSHLVVGDSHNGYKKTSTNQLCVDVKTPMKSKKRTNVRCENEQKLNTETELKCVSKSEHKVSADEKSTEYCELSLIRKEINGVFPNKQNSNTEVEQRMQRKRKHTDLTTTTEQKVAVIVSKDGKYNNENSSETSLKSNITQSQLVRTGEKKVDRKRKNIVISQLETKRKVIKSVENDDKMVNNALTTIQIQNKKQHNMNLDIKNAALETSCQKLFSNLKNDKYNEQGITVFQNNEVTTYKNTCPSDHTSNVNMQKPALLIFSKVRNSCVSNNMKCKQGNNNVQIYKNKQNANQSINEINNQKHNLSHQAKVCKKATIGMNRQNQKLCHNSSATVMQYMAATNRTIASVKFGKSNTKNDELCCTSDIEQSKVRLSKSSVPVLKQLQATNILQKDKPSNANAEWKAGNPINSQHLPTLPIPCNELEHTPIKMIVCEEMKDKIVPSKHFNLNNGTQSERATKQKYSLNTVSGKVKLRGIVNKVTSLTSTKKLDCSDDKVMSSHNSPNENMSTEISTPETLLTTKLIEIEENEIKHNLSSTTEKEKTNELANTTTQHETTIKEPSKGVPTELRKKESETGKTETNHAELCFTRELKKQTLDKNTHYKIQSNYNSTNTSAKVKTGEKLLQIEKLVLGKEIKSENSLNSPKDEINKKVQTNNISNKPKIHEPNCRNINEQISKESQNRNHTFDLKKELRKKTESQLTKDSKSSGGNDRQSNKAKFCGIIDKVLHMSPHNNLQNNYKIHEIMHSGFHSTILKGRNKQDNHPVAIKLLHNKFANFHENHLDILQTLLSSDDYKHFNCIGIEDIVSSRSRWCIITEYFPHNLAQVLELNEGGFHIDKVQVLSRQLLNALMLLRIQEILHKDIKPEHILINVEHTTLKLSGFDRAIRAKNAKISFQSQPLHYLAPEIIIGVDNGYPAEIWAVACIMYQMVTNQVPFEGINAGVVLRNTISRQGYLSKDLIKKGKFSSQYFQMASQQFELLKNVSKSRYIKSLREKVVYACSGLTSEGDRKIRLLCDLLDGMLIVDYRMRQTIELAYTHPFIYI